MNIRPSLLYPSLVLSLFLGGCNNADDGPIDLGLGGELNTGSDSATACDKDDDCDDSIFCNGEESCDDGFCSRGTRVVCDDGIDCTVERCVESSQACTSMLPDAD